MMLVPNCCLISLPERIMDGSLVRTAPDREQSEFVKQVT